MEHFNDPSIPDDFKCFECKVGYTAKSGKNYHLKRAHTISPSNMCIECGFIVSKNQEKTHGRFHDSIISDELKCFECKVGFLYKNEIKQHFMQKVHKNSKSFVPEEFKSSNRPKKITLDRFYDPSTPDKYKCFACKAGFKNKGAINYHLVQEHKTSLNSTCKDCGYIISRNEEKDHAFFHDSTISDELKCFECKVGFLYKKEIKKHLERSVHQSSNTCYCGYKIIWNRAKIHELFHDSTIPENLKCFTCKVGFEKQARINHHLIYVHKISPHTPEAIKFLAQKGA